MTFSWKAFYLFLYLYRCAASVLAVVIVSKYTGLGDVSRYLTAQLTLDALDVSGAELSLTFQRHLAVVLTGGLTSLLKFLSFGNAILIHIWFQTLAFIGIYMLLKRLEPKVRRPVALVFMFPSFAVWSAVISKEALVVLAVCLALTYLVDIYYNRERIRFYHLIGFALLAILKTQYLIAFAYLIVITKLARHVQQRAALALGAGLISLTALYIFRDRIDSLAFTAMAHVRTGVGTSTREPYWVEQYDVFWKAPYGMFQSFFGPTLGEAMSGHPLQVASFLESLVLIGLLIFYATRGLNRLPAYNLIVGAFAAFWMLFPTYPLGIMNPGTAVRYRTGYLAVIAIIFLFLSSRELYLSWRQGVVTPSKRRGPAPSTAA